MKVDKAYILNLINRSLYAEANRHLHQLLTEDPDNHTYKQLQALSYSRSGALETAKDFFEPVYQSHEDDDEISGIMGGIYKRLFHKYQDVDYGKLTAEIYEKNYRKTGSTYTGINAASMLFMTGRSKEGKSIAIDLIDQLDSESNDLWTLATLGEAYLLLKNTEDSKNYYVKARKRIDKDWGSLNSIYNQLFLLNHYIRVPKQLLELFSPPVLCVFAGHMVDHPNRATPRFTPAMIPDIKDAIHSALKTMDAQIGYCSLACGADLLFAEAMIEQEKSINAILPFDEEDFLDQSVRFAGDEWIDRYQKFKALNKVGYISKNNFNGRNESFEFLSKITMGKGILHAQRIGSKVKLLTVLSSTSLEAKSGGTRYLYDLWPGKFDSQNINTDNYLKPADPPQNPVEESEKHYNSNFRLSYFIMMNANDQPAHDFYQEELRHWLDSGYYEHYSFGTSENMIYLYFKSEMETIEVLKEIYDIYEELRTQHTDLSQPTILGHAGFINWQNNKAGEGIDLDNAHQIFNQVTPATSHFTENLAACLVLSNQNFPFNYNGLVQAYDEEYMPIYSIPLSEL